MKEMPKWLKAKGYLHITESISVQTNWRLYVHRIKSSAFIAQYAFYPLLHRELKERRYKKPTPNKHKGKKRAHSHYCVLSKKVERSIKSRPLHYATHFDSLIYAYYAEILKDKYESFLKEHPVLSQSITAYRTIAISKTDSKGKSNIHFAKESFEEITNRVQVDGETAVLAMDLKSFFSSLDHNHLYKAWANILTENELPLDHYNVFKACTRFRYILLDDLRIKRNRGFDEEKLALIRKKKGYKSFFTDNKEFRNAIKTGKVPIYKNSFRRKEEDGTKTKVGIPQGLALSSILANIYLLEFDKKIIQELVKKKGFFYRRYSDDILICCPEKELKNTQKYINDLVNEYRIEISKDKTECFLFKMDAYNKNNDQRLTSFKINESGYTPHSPLVYLGFEFRGYNVLIKSANLAKYYRRMISIIKRRSKRAIKLSKANPTIPRAVFINQIKKMYNSPLKHSKKKENKQIFRNRSYLVVNDRGEFEFESQQILGRQSNYISYIKRCDEIFNTKSFSLQLKKKNIIIGQAIKKHLIQAR